MSSVPEGWSECFLEALGVDKKSVVKAGPFGSALKKDCYTTSGYKVYGQEQVIRTDLTYGEYYVPESKYRELIACSVQSGDLLVSLVGTFGQILLVPECFQEGVINPRLLRIRIDQRTVLPSYLRCYLLSPLIVAVLNKVAQGGTMGVLNAGIVRKLNILLPPLPEQKRIAAILSSVDDAIAATEAVIEQTQRVKEGLLQDLLTRGIGHTRFKQTELGEIPEGWEVKRLEDVCERITDGEHQTPKRSDCGYYLLSARNVRDGYIDLGNVDYVPKDEYQRLCKRITPKAGDVLISCSGSVGRVAVVPVGLEFAMVRSVAILQIDHSKLDSKFIAYQLAAPMLQNQIKSSMSQLAQANLFQGSIKKLKIVVPTLREQKELSSKLDTLVTSLEHYQCRLTQLQQTKRGLMQDLLSGDVRVVV